MGVQLHGGGRFSVHRRRVSLQVRTLLKIPRWPCAPVGDRTEIAAMVSDPEMVGFWTLPLPHLLCCPQVRQGVLFFRKE